MLNKLKGIIKSRLVDAGYYGFDTDVRLSYSQMGEDLFLESIFLNRNDGFYIDIGAFDPKLYSNTYIFYLKGWTGINIDARPKSMVAFKKKRPRDINIEAAVSNKIAKKLYFMSDAPALNTLSTKRAREIPRLTEYKIVEKKTLKTVRLKDVLNMHVPKDKKIDFMNVDVEGLDLDVLRSNDWNKFVPSIVVVESLQNKKSVKSKNSIDTFMKSKGYVLIAKLNVSHIYQLKK